MSLEDKGKKSGNAKKGTKRTDKRCALIWLRGVYKAGWHNVWTTIFTHQFSTIIRDYRLQKQKT